MGRYGCSYPVSSRSPRFSCPRIFESDSKESPAFELRSWAHPHRFRPSSVWIPVSPCPNFHYPASFSLSHLDWDFQIVSVEGENLPEFRFAEKAQGSVGYRLLSKYFTNWRWYSSNTVMKVVYFLSCSTELSYEEFFGTLRALSMTAMANQRFI